MNIPIKDYLRDNPCYLVAAIVLASEGDNEILEQIYGNEMAAFGALKIARVTEHHSKTHPSYDFPISLSRNNEIIKIPERLAGFVFSGKSFWGVQCDAKPQALYSKEWLKQFSPKDRAKLLEKYKEITSEEAAPKSKASHPEPSSISAYPNENSSRKNNA